MGKTTERTTAAPSRDRPGEYSPENSAPTTSRSSDDLVGAIRLILDGVHGVTDIVEGMHLNIAGLAPIVGPSRPGPTKGITGLVYRNVRRVSGLVGTGLEATLRQLPPLLDGRTGSYRPESTLAILNGVLGDHLEASGNPLAIPMEFRSDGLALPLEREALAATFPQPSNRLLVLVHGLCMSDQQWHRNDHDHGLALARDLGYTPLYLRYNSGRPVADNGREFASQLENLVSQWPVPVHELVIIGHSMGGLVSRSACLWAREAGHSWPGQLKKMIFLGTPHHGSALERLGNRFESLMGISPYSEPIGRLGRVRSAGIMDLREGNIHHEDLRQSVSGETGTWTALPPGTRCYTIAATTQASPDDDTTATRGDGLVPLNSALGQHQDPDRCLPFPPSRQAVFHGLNHFGLLDSQEVYERMLAWLAES